MAVWLRRLVIIPGRPVFVVCIESAVIHCKVQCGEVDRLAFLKFLAEQKRRAIFEACDQAVILITK